MLKFLNDDILKQVREVFDAQLKQPVEVLFFGSTNEENCAYCTDTRQLMEEVVAISDRLHLSVYDIEKDAQTAETYHVDKTPTLVIAGRGGYSPTSGYSPSGEDGSSAGETADTVHPLVDYGVRFTGLPSGHEFSSLIHSLILVSGRDSGLNPQTRQFLQELTKPIHLQVFVTPT
jgi:glutaredoxin